VARVFPPFVKKLALPLLLIPLLSFWVLYIPLPDPLRLYSNSCRDDLERLYVKIINRAASTIDLSIFALSRPRVIDALNRAAARGVDVHIAFDDRESRDLPNKLHPAIRHTPQRPKGLMHQKRLIVDRKILLVGSANLTHESLRMHSNLVVGQDNPSLASALLSDPSPYEPTSAEPLLNAIRAAKRSLRIAMFTWTHPELTAAAIEAHQRGIDVEIILDGTSARGASRATAEALRAAGIPLHTSRGPGLLHHKLVWIDENRLLTGSINWTQGAFTKNSEILLDIQDLKKRERKKLSHLWQHLKAGAFS